MKVHELIDKLKDYDLELDVVTEFEGGYYSVNKIELYEFEEGKSLIIS